MLPVEIVRCVSIGEVRARLAGGRAWSALLADAALPGVDRDLVATATDAGCPTLLVDEGGARDLAALAAAAVIGAPFSRDELLLLLEAHARPVSAGDAEVVPGPREVPSDRLGAVIAVTGSGGTGTSIVASALAQGLAAPPATGRRRRRIDTGGRDGLGERTASSHATAASRSAAGRPARDVLLADLCRRADQAILHDARTLTPGLRDVAEAHRTRTPSPRDLRDQTFAVEARGYHLLLGLRRPSHWATLQPRVVDATLDGLRAAFEVVVADVDPDLEGEGQTGSRTVEDRHHLTRATVDRADVVAVTFDPSMLGCGKAVRLVTELLGAGVAPERLLLVANRAPRSPRARAEVATALADLLAAAAGPVAARVAAPLGLPERPVDAAVRDGLPLPAPLPDKLAAAVLALLARAPARVVAAAPVPVRIRPGELGLGALGGGGDGRPSGAPGAPGEDAP